MKLFWIGILCLVVASILAVVFNGPTSQGLAPLEESSGAHAEISSASGTTVNAAGQDQGIDHQGHTPAATSTLPKRPGDDAVAQGSMNAVGESTSNSASEGGDVHADQPSGVERDEEGRLLLNGRYPIEGAGTEEDPYRIYWPLLISTAATYKPEDEGDPLPVWLRAIDGARVELSGFLFLPLVQQETGDVLLMFNQWDGCCVGVPPSPYDSTEVILKKPVNLSQSSVAYATARGRLHVDPYIRKGWLIGLYVIEDASLLLPDL